MCQSIRHYFRNCLRNSRNPVYEITDSQVLCNSQMWCPQVCSPILSYLPRTSIPLKYETTLPTNQWNPKVKKMNMSQLTSLNMLFIKSWRIIYCKLPFWPPVSLILHKNQLRMCKMTVFFDKAKSMGEFSW